MLIPGLVSVTFRKLSVEEIVKISKENGLKAIEWGADVHAKKGEFERLAEVNKITTSSDLSCYSYGSYYWCGYDDPNDFDIVLKSAKILGVKNIRAWAGKKGSAEATGEDVNCTVEDLSRCASLASKEGITLSCEYHPNTLTDTRESALELVKNVGNKNFKLYWQPTFVLSDKENLKSLETILPWVSNVHLFSWEGLGSKRYPLSNSIEMFKECANMLRGVGGEHGLFLEFVKDDSVEQFIQDSATLLEILK